jgi:Family of unknown function (DUF6402)
MPLSKNPRSLGLDPWAASTRTNGPLGTNKDAGDPSTPSWFIGDTPRSIGNVHLPKHENGSAAPKLDFRSGKSYVALAGLSELSYDLVQEDKYLPFIPDVMTANNWLNAAALMERWFSSSPYTAPKEYCPPDDTETIKMESWLLTFDKARSRYITLVNRLTNQPTHERLAKVIKTPGLIGKPDSQGESRIGDDLSPKQWESCYANSIAYEASPADTINDLFCALGTFQLRLTVRGRCKPVVPGTAPHQMDVWIDSYGVYAIDSYDFTDKPGEETQELGYWNIKEKSAAKASGGLQTIHLTNASFQRYRDKHGKGGDFRVFSDIYWTRLDREFYLAL